MLQKNDEIPLHIDSCTLLGSGVGRYSGQTVFAEGTAPGEDVRVHIIKAKKSYAVGKVIEIITPSESRVTPDCPVCAACGGCVFRHITYEEELKIKEAQIRENFKRIAKISPQFESITPSPAVNRSRNKAQYPIRRDKNGDVIAGFFSSHSHRIIKCDDCLLQPVEFKKILDAVKSVIQKQNISVYDEASGTGLIRHIYLRKGEVTGEIGVVVVINGDSLPAQEIFIDEILKTESNVTSIVINKNKALTNVVLGEESKTIYGKDYIEDVLCGVRLRISPHAFYQVNHAAAELLYKKAAEYACADSSKTIMDMYCGTGSIGLSMAKSAKAVIGVDIIPQAIENARKNAQINSIDNAEFICSDAGKAAEILKNSNIGADVIILDPPRKGCSDELISCVSLIAPQRIVYISCDSSSLARDCEKFNNLGYAPVKAAAFDLFPRTAHVEAVCCLYHQKKDFISVQYEPKDDGYMNLLK